MAIPFSKKEHCESLNSLYIVSSIAYMDDPLLNVPDLPSPLLPIFMSAILFFLLAPIFVVIMSYFYLTTGNTPPILMCLSLFIIIDVIYRCPCTTIERNSII